MAQLVIWTAFLLFMLMLCMRLSNRILLTPQFCIVACFIPQAIYAFFWIKKWDLYLSLETMVVLVGGVGTFVIVSLVYNSLCKKNKSVQSEPLFTSLGIKQWKLVVLFVFQMLTLALMCRELIRISGGLSVTESAKYLRDINFFTDDNIEMSGVVYKMRMFSVASGYVWFYLLVYSVIYKRKNNFFWIICNCIASCLNALILGSRGSMVNMILAAVFQYYFILGICKGWKRSVNRNLIKKIVIFSILGIIVFQESADLVGRSSTMDFNEYISAYLSAQLKNLDIFVREGKFGTDILNCQTLVNLVNFFGRHLGIDSIIHKADLPFHRVNGYYLGNVYTMFYPFMYDAGYFGVAVFTTVMAVICQGSFNAVRKIRNINRIQLSLIVYTYIMSMICFSFFSEKFYSNIITFDFVWNVFFWVIIIWFLNGHNPTKFKIRI